MIRRGSPVAGGAVRILGFDAAGTVEAIGPEVTRFGVVDNVYCAGVTKLNPARRGTEAGNGRWPSSALDFRRVGHEIG